LLKNHLGKSVPCAVKEFIHETRRRSVFRKFRAVQMSPDTRYTYLHHLCTATTWRRQRSWD